MFSLWLIWSLAESKILTINSLVTLLVSRDFVTWLNRQRIYEVILNV
ncbi:hypothetical protein Phpb_00593 [Photorhabdus namnaonensis]|uniref:Uncharacterized protein n=1 Tax=Photorhabdus namnaonensis TaxID=1851568 RepID=A0A1B8YLR5_9GAMM|nr:hypothetical protein Phpb_00593 [Photorhabdus namnaonensis]